MVVKSVSQRACDAEREKKVREKIPMYENYPNIWTSNIHGLAYLYSIFCGWWTDTHTRNSKPFPAVFILQRIATIAFSVFFFFSLAQHGIKMWRGERKFVGRQYGNSIRVRTTYNLVFTGTQSSSIISESESLGVLAYKVQTPNAYTSHFTFHVRSLFVCYQCLVFDVQVCNQ